MISCTVIAVARAERLTAVYTRVSPEKPGSMPLMYREVPPVVACLLQRITQPVVGMLGRDQPDHRGTNDIGARGKEPTDLVDGVAGAGLGLRRVHDTVGVEGDQRLGVVGGHHAAGGREPTQLCGVAADLLRTVGVHADEFEVWAVR